MYIRTAPPSDLSLQGLLEWLLLEFQSLENELAEQEAVIQKLKDNQNAL